MCAGDVMFTWHWLPYIISLVIGALYSAQQSAWEWLGNTKRVRLVPPRCFVKTQCLSVWLTLLRRQQTSAIQTEKKVNVSLMSSVAESRIESWQDRGNNEVTVWGQSGSSPWRQLLSLPEITWRCLLTQCFLGMITWHYLLSDTMFPMDDHVILSTIWHNAFFSYASRQVTSSDCCTIQTASVCLSVLLDQNKSQRQTITMDTHLPRLRSIRRCRWLQTHIKDSASVLLSRQQTLLRSCNE